MNKPLQFIRCISLFLICIWLCSCASIKPSVVVKNSSLDSFKYAYVNPTSSVTSNTGSTINGQYYSSSKSINPGEMVAGILAKEGFIILNDFKQELERQTIIVNYGESGRRSTGITGYAIEITLQFISANTLICSCTAEGQGSTEVDDIRIAIKKCFKELLPKKEKK